MLFLSYDALRYPISVSRQYARVKDKNHVHDFMQIIHVNGGSYTHYLGNGSSTMYETGLTIIPPGLSHFADARWAENDLFFCDFANRLFGEDTGNAWSFFNICLSPLGDAAYNKTPFLKPRHTTDGEIYRLFCELHEAGKTSSDDNLPLMRAKTAELLSLISSEYIAQQGVLSKRGMSDYCPSVYAIFNFIHKNYQNDIRAEHVAREGMMSLRSFHRIFPEIMGMTFVKYLNYLRIKHAKELLEGTNLIMRDIAELSGFVNTTHFNRTFHEKTGFSPSKWRDFSRLDA